MPVFTIRISPLAATSLALSIVPVGVSMSLAPQAVRTAAVLGAAVLTACGAKDIETPTGTIDKAKDVAAKGEILMVKTGIAAYVVTNAAAPPEATQGVLAGYVDPWPENPW